MGNKALGILGGMGPYATASFFNKILTLTPAQKDWDHMRIILDNNPHIPSRTRHILYQEESPVPQMIACCKKLESYPVDLIVIPCNSACYFIDQVRPHVDIEVANIIEITSDYASQGIGRSANCLVFGGHITYTFKTYNPFLKDRGLKYVHHSPEDQAVVEDFIEKIKISGNSSSLEGELVHFTNKMMEKFNAELVILGCTEFGCLQKSSLKDRIVDSNHSLAKYVVGKVL